MVAASLSMNSRLSSWSSVLKIDGMPASEFGSVALIAIDWPAPILNEYHAGALAGTVVTYWPAP